MLKDALDAQVSDEAQASQIYLSNGSWAKKNGLSGIANFLFRNEVEGHSLMPELDGFELLLVINQRLKNAVAPPFLYLKANVNPPFFQQGLHLRADDYKFKPCDHVDVINSVQLYLGKRSQKVVIGNDESSKVNTPVFAKLALPCDDGLILVSFNDIIRCQADRSYCIFHLVKGESILVSKSMKEFEQLLLENTFVRVHKSTIVNINHAKKYVRGDGGQLIMSDNAIVCVSARRKEGLLHLLRHQSNTGMEITK
ncbi:MAG: hypothetical protein A3D92_02910 [Bacteroidetes bacterium RIFCSPHIGHO2_02_FULL_44_7]|nr:MAG: hypothetical protein A3D92_02910 [Bacteroidetes bacterium RIFCSPHIGHO2_02_FULL_44_7]